MTQADLTANLRIAAMRCSAFKRASRRLSCPHQGTIHSRPAYAASGASTAAINGATTRDTCSRPCIRSFSAAFAVSIRMGTAGSSLATLQTYSEAVTNVRFFSCSAVGAGHCRETGECK